MSDTVFVDKLATFRALTLVMSGDAIKRDDIADKIANVMSDAAFCDDVPAILRALNNALMQTSVELVRVEAHAFRAINRLAAFQDRVASQFFLAQESDTEFTF